LKKFDFRHCKKERRSNPKPFFQGSVSKTCHPALDEESPKKHNTYHQGITGQARNDITVKKTFEAALAGLLRATALAMTLQQITIQINIDSVFCKQQK